MRGAGNRAGLLREIRVKELNVERKIRLVYPARRALSHAAKAFLEVVKNATADAARLQLKAESLVAPAAQEPV